MAACNFSIPFTGSAEDIYNKAKAAVEKQGGTFEGDTTSGTFSINVFGTIQGSYAISGQQLDIVIDHKPLLISCSMIEQALKNQIG
jgi:hypothetical protein